jgi:hypothetical protein
MKSIKHSKIKNTGLIFELLVRQIASDTLNNKESKAIPILKKYFNKNTELSKELNLYKSLTSEKFNKEEKANALIEAVLKSHKQLNSAALSKQKYNLVKDINEVFGVDTFFSSKVNEYKVLASVYKILEYSEADSPIEIVNSKYTIIEYITGKEIIKEEISEDLKTFISEDKDVRLTAYKYLVNKFNNKYNTLDTKQKNLLREYINNVSSTDELTTYVVNEIHDMLKVLQVYNKKVDSPVVKIKLNEVSNLLKSMSNVKSVNDNHILSLLRYYELLKELKKV